MNVGTASFKWLETLLFSSNCGVWNTPLSFIRSGWSNRWMFIRESCLEERLPDMGIRDPSFVDGISFRFPPDMVFHVKHVWQFRFRPTSSISELRWHFPLTALGGFGIYFQWVLSHSHWWKYGIITWAGNKGSVISKKKKTKRKHNSTLLLVSERKRIHPSHV